MIPKCKAAIRTRNNNFSNLQLSKGLFQVFFFPSTLNDWFWLDNNIRHSKSISMFKSRLLSFIHPNQSNIFNIFEPIGLNLLPRLCLGLSHLNEHIFGHNFQGCVNPSCFCSLEIEDITHPTFCTTDSFLTIPRIFE